MKRCFNRGGPFLLALLETVKGCAQGGCLFSFQEYPVSDAASDGLSGVSTPKPTGIGGKSHTLSGQKFRIFELGIGVEEAVGLPKTPRPAD